MSGVNGSKRGPLNQRRRTKDPTRQSFGAQVSQHDNRNGDSDGEHSDLGSIMKDIDRKLNRKRSPDKVDPEKYYTDQEGLNRNKYEPYN